MESLKIRTGQVNLQIEDDAGNVRGIFSFNPQDVEAAKRFVALQQEFNAKQAEFDEKAKLAETTEQQVNLLNEVVDYFRGLVDECFGEGSSDLLFGNAKTLSMFEDFFIGITPYYQKASEARIAKYGVK